MNWFGFKLILHGYKCKLNSICPNIYIYHCVILIKLYVLEIYSNIFSDIHNLIYDGILNVLDSNRSTM